MLWAQNTVAQPLVMQMFVDDPVLHLIALIDRIVQVRSLCVLV